MKSLTVIIQPDGVVSLEGDLTFATIHKKTVQLIDFKKIPQEIVIDFSQVKQSDSAGLALLIEWLKIAKQTNKSCKFKHLPQQLLTLAKLSGFEIACYFVSAS
jgi:phospholipid transport system transporter-binding protein